MQFHPSNYLVIDLYLPSAIYGLVDKQREDMGSGHGGRRRQQNKSTGDRRAQLSSDPEARIGAHVAGMRICPALISHPGTTSLWTRVFLSKRGKITRRNWVHTYIHTHTNTLESDCGDTQNMFKGEGQVQGWSGMRDEKKTILLLTVGWQRDKDMSAYTHTHKKKLCACAK